VVIIVDGNTTVGVAVEYTFWPMAVGENKALAGEGEFAGSLDANMGWL
jgi:hypothetical protein